jgi:hypothetical protein
MSIETRNAVITSARLTTADHGLLSAWLMLDYGGSGQGFGGHALYLPKDFKHHNDRHGNCCGLFIWRVMEVAGVTEWADLPGKTIRVNADHSSVYAIGHIVKDIWFDPREEFAQLKAARKE